MHKHVGIPLSSVAAVSEKIQEKLRELHVSTAEEFLAMAAVEGCKKGLGKHLGMTTAQMTGLVAKLRKSVPERTVAAMEQPYAQELGLGAMEPPATMRMAAAGPFESAVNVAALPANVNLISRMPPIKSQAARGTCVGFACTALNEDYNTVVKGSTPDLSEQCLYKRCKEVDGDPNANGTFVYVAMDLLLNTGEPTEACEPYNPNLPTNQPGPHPPCCAAESPNYKIFKKIQLNQNSPNDIKAALADNRVVAFSIPVFHSWYDSAAVRQSGNITMPLPGEDPFNGHAMLFVGYQDDASTPGGGYFILRNSWGTTSFGPACTYGAGYGTIPYQYMVNCGWEAWTYDRPPVVCPVRPTCPARPIFRCPPSPCPPRPRICPPSPCPPRPIICPPSPCPPRPLVCPARPLYYNPHFLDYSDPWAAASYPQENYGYPQAGYPYGYDPQYGYYSGYEYPPEYYSSTGYAPCSGYWQGYDPGTDPASVPFQAGQFNPAMKEKT